MTRRLFGGFFGPTAPVASYSQWWLDHTPGIFQTYYGSLPPQIIHNRRQFAPEFNKTTLNDPECREWLRLNYGEMYVEIFDDTLWTGAHKADLMRYCWLWRYGGIYLDVKTVLLASLLSFLGDKPEGTLITVIAGGYRSHNGFIVCEAHDPVIFAAIQGVLACTKAEIDNEYLIFCKQLWHYIKDDLQQRTPQVGWNDNGPAKRSIYLLEEKMLDPWAPRCVDASGAVIECDGHYIVDKGVPFLATRIATYKHGHGFDGDAHPAPIGSWKLSARHDRFADITLGIFGALLRKKGSQVLRRDIIALEEGASYSNDDGFFKRDGGDTYISGRTRELKQLVTAYQWRRAPLLVTACHDFDASEYGESYLPLRKGQIGTRLFIIFVQRTVL